MQFFLIDIDLMSKLRPDNVRRIVSEKVLFFYHFDHTLPIMQFTWLGVGFDRHLPDTPVDSLYRSEPSGVPLGS